MAGLFSTFGQNTSVGTPGVTTKQIGGGIGGLIAGGPIQGSTTPFAQGGNASPNNLLGGLNLGNGVKSLGIQAQSPNQNITPSTTSLPPNQGSPIQTSGPSSYQQNLQNYGLSSIPTGYSFNASGKLVNGAGQEYAPSSGSSVQSAVLGAGQNLLTNPPPGVGISPAGVGPNGVNTVPITPVSNMPGNQTVTPPPTTAAPTTSQGLISSLVGASNNPNVQNIVNQEQKDLDDTLTGQPGLPYQIAQGRAGLIQTNANGAIANTLQEQNLQQSALGTALGATTQTTPAPYGTPLYNPASGTYTSSAGVNGGNLSPQTTGTQNATAVLSGQMSYSDAVAAMNNLYGGAGQQILNQAILSQNPNANINQLEGQASATQSNASTAGTASTTANQGVYNNALSSLSNVQQMASNIKQFGDQAINNISSLPLTSSQLANTTIQQAMTQFNSPQFAKFNANIQGLQARVAALLGTGEIPTSATAGAQAIINGTLNLNALQATMNQINSEAGVIVGNAATQASNAFSNIQENSGSSNSSNSGGWASLGD